MPVHRTCLKPACRPYVRSGAWAPVDRSSLNLFYVNMRRVTSVKYLSSTAKAFSTYQMLGYQSWSVTYIRNHLFSIERNSFLMDCSSLKLGAALNIYVNFFIRSFLHSTYSRTVPSPQNHCLLLLICFRIASLWWCTLFSLMRRQIFTILAFDVFHLQRIVYCTRNLLNWTRSQPSCRFHLCFIASLQIE